MRRLSIALGTLLIAGLVSGAEPSQADSSVIFEGEGVEVVVASNPFGMTFRDPVTGVELVQASVDGPPVRAEVVPLQPEPIGERGGHGPFTFVVGGSALAQFQGTFWSGADAVSLTSGAAFHVTELLDVASEGDRHTLTVATSLPDAAPATVELAFDAPGRVQVSFMPPVGAPVAAVGDAFASPTDEQFYGMGERYDDVAQRGKWRQVWVEGQNWDAPDERSEETLGLPSAFNTLFGEEWKFPNGPGGSYYPQALLYSSRGFGLALDETARSLFDLAASRDDVFRFGVRDPDISYAVQFGGQAGLYGAVDGLTDVTGKAPPPPKSAFEPWLDVLINGENILDPDVAYEEMQAAVGAIEEHDLPIGVFGLETWGALDDSPDYDLGAIVEELRAAHGFEVAAYFAPFLSPGSEFYDRAVELDAVVEDRFGNPHLSLGLAMAPTAYIDPTAPGAQTLWDEHLGRVLDLGFRLFMHDFGEQIQQDMHFANGEDGRTMHNGYPVEWGHLARRTVETWEVNNPTEDVFFYMRAGYNGSVEATGGVFPGDETSDWGKGTGLPSVLPAMLNLSVGGVPFFTTDIAGYSEHTGAADAELYTRWSQFAALSPMMRVHSSPGGNRHPWHYDETTLEQFRIYAELHHRLVPYIYDAALEATETGLGIARPLYLEDPSTPPGALDRQYMLGDDLLVAPVLERGATAVDVYLPAGSSWQRLSVEAPGCLQPVGDVVSGGGLHSVPVDITEQPVFVRSGAANPAPCP